MVKIRVSSEIRVFNRNGNFHAENKMVGQVGMQFVVYYSSQK